MPFTIHIPVIFQAPTAATATSTLPPTTTMTPIITSRETKMSLQTAGHLRNGTDLTNLYTTCYIKLTLLVHTHGENGSAS
jgi:hypothetical protein